MTCGACGTLIPESMAGILEHLTSAGLKGDRQVALATMYGGEAPGVLCWECFKATVHVLNGVQQ